MKKIFFRCKNCLFPSTKPDLHFDEKGVCMACKYVKHYKSIDWKKRKEDFLKLIEKIQKDNINKSNYDCTIGVSGGKDSTYQTYLITKVLGLKPLLLSFEPSFPTEVGKVNLEHIVKAYGCDLIQLKKSPTYKKLARIGFDVVGDHEWPNHVGIFCWPVQMASKLNIHANFLGEPNGLIGLGRWEAFLKEGAEELTRSDVEQYQGFNGYRISDMMQYDKSIKLKDVIPYIYPSKKDLNSVSKTYMLGHFFQWDREQIIELIKGHGWKSNETHTEGTFTNYDSIDCGFMPIHQYFKFIKYGYGRATDHASYEIREGRMNKKQAKELIIEYDGKAPKKYFNEFLEFLDITEDHFYKTRDRFTNPVLFKKDDNDNFSYNNNKNLILNKTWHDSFDE